MRLLFFISVLLLLDWYVFQAFRTVAQNWSPSTKNLWYTLYWIFPAITIGSLFLAFWGDTSIFSKTFINFFRAFLFIIYVSKLLIWGVLVVDDLRRLFMWGFEHFSGHAQLTDRSRSKFLSHLGIFLGSIPFVSLTYGIIRNPYRYKRHRQTVHIKDLPEELEGLRIVQISDIHSGSLMFKEPVRLAIDMINDAQPDLVFFTGDLVNNLAAEMEPFVDVFDKINARYGVYSVLGNHDYGDYVRWDNYEMKRRNLERLLETHQRMGWDILLNENRMIDINGRQVAVLGVENYSAHPRFPKYGDLQKAYEGTEKADIRLLLSHDPTHWEDQVTTQYSDIAITFSGHTHGMQFGVEIPGWFKWSPIQYIYKQWAGLYERDGQYLYVNRGLGVLGYPGRVGILPEITVMDLRRAAV